MAWPAVKRKFTQEQFRAYVESLAWSWRPSLIVLHNTAAPSLAQWHETSERDRKAGLVPGTSRINSLESYFRDQKHWSGSPHLFVADDGIWVFNPLTRPGTHSPSWNSISIGIEMVADFDKEDDDAGDGLKVRRNAEFATAVLCETLGLDPRKAIKLHREDPETTHACPGKDFADDRAQVIEEIAALMVVDHGEHGQDDVAIAIGAKPAPPPPEAKHGVVTTDGLNLRVGAGVTSKAIRALAKGTELMVLAGTNNGATPWLKVRTAGDVEGWVAGKYVRIT